MKDNNRKGAKSNKMLSLRTGRMFPCHLLLPGLGLTETAGSLGALRTRPSWQWHPAQGTCRTCLQFVFIFRHICKCSLKNTSPHENQGNSRRHPESSKAVIAAAFLTQEYNRISLKSSGVQPRPCLLAIWGLTLQTLSCVNVTKCEVFLSQAITSKPFMRPRRDTSFDIDSKRCQTSDFNLGTQKLGLKEEKRARTSQQSPM